MSGKGNNQLNAQLQQLLQQWGGGGNGAITPAAAYDQSGQMIWTPQQSGIVQQPQPQYQMQPLQQPVIHPPQIINVPHSPGQQYIPPMPPILNYQNQKPQIPLPDYWIPVIRLWNAGRRAPGRFWRLLFLSYDWIFAWIDQPLGSLCSVGVIVVGSMGVFFIGTGMIAWMTGRDVIVSPPKGDITEVQQVIERNLPEVHLK